MTATRWLATLVLRLRAAGAAVPPARVLDAAHTLLAVGDLTTDRETLAMMLRVTLAQSRMEQALFDGVFHAFIAAHGPPRPTPKRSAKGRAGALDTGRGGTGATVAGDAVRTPGGPPPHTPRPSSGPRPRPDDAAGKRASAYAEGRIDADAGRRRDAEPRDADRAARAGAPSSAAEAPRPKSSDERLLSLVAEQREAAERAGPALRRFGARSPQRTGASGPPAVGREPDIVARPPLTPETLASLRRMAQTLWWRRSRRTRRFKRGRLDRKATLAYALRTDGIPMRLLHRRRRLRQARLLLLLDVSGSMRETAPLVLALAEGLRDAFASVRTFVFVDHLIEGAGDGFGDAEVNWMSRSDYGNVFFELLRRHDRLLRKDALLVVMGDARNNFSDAMTWCIAEIRSRVGALLWLNPEVRARWDRGDSVIGQYAPWCDAVLRCVSQDDLRRAAESMLRQAARWRC